MSAWFGRNDILTCSENGCGDCSTSCYFDIKNILAGNINNTENSYTITFENSIYTPPCIGTKKYLIITYECI